LRFSPWLALLSLPLTLPICLNAAAQVCPDRPARGTVVQNPYNISSVNGVLSASLSLARSTDSLGYVHYCYRYNLGNQVIEAPTLRVNPGDKLNLKVVNNITDTDAIKMTMKPSAASGKPCGDGGAETLSSTNVHFHGLNVAPTCHQDDVLNTLIQPGTPGFQYSVQIPQTEPPGLYWYHPHIHGFTEFQVNGGAAGAIVVEGMEKFRPEVKGLPERILVIRQQYLVPWVPGPYQLTVNYQTAPPPKVGLQEPVIQMQPGQSEFWRVANASLQDFLQLQVLENDQAMPLQMIAIDGYPLAQTHLESTILIPPAGRAEFIVHAPPAGVTTQLYTAQYTTGPTGNPDVAQDLASIQLAPSGGQSAPMSGGSSH
jgi:FtsP/CotA-like multicopper oxidase with cupredoxin domain